jgi:putative ABC transport system permease protein
MWVHFETSFDTFNKNGDRVALVMKHSLMNNQKNSSSSLMMPVYDELKTNYPEIKRISRLDWGSVHSLVIQNRKFKKEGLLRRSRLSENFHITRYQRQH